MHAMSGLSSDKHGDHVNEHHHCYAGNHSREKKDYGHEHAGPPRIGLYGPEDKTNVPMEQKGRRNSDDSYDVTAFLSKAMAFSETSVVYKESIR